jgi:ribonuclease HI
MELLAAITALQASEACVVSVIADSLSLQQGMTIHLQRRRQRV